MGSVSWRKRGNRYLVSWRLDDGSQGGKTVDTPDEARDLAAEKRLEMRRGTWGERRRGRLSFGQWADDWWSVWATDPDRSPTTLAATENRLRRHVRPWFSDRPIERIGPAEVRRWQAQLAAKVGRESLLACRSILHRILQFAEDEGAIPSSPVRKVPPPKRRADPEQLLGEAKRRAYTPEEAGRLLGRIPVFWWDHVLTFLGTGLRFGELAGLRCRRVHLHRPVPVLQVVDVRYQAGRQFGSGFKARPKSDAGIRELPLAPLVIESIRRQLPPDSDPDSDPDLLVFTGPGGGNGIPVGTRTMLSRYNFRRVYQRAVARVGNDLVEVDPHGPHDLRHTFSTWLEDAGIPARVIDELMGHERSRRGELESGSRIGARYRHTTPEMAVRVAASIQERLVVVVQVAEAILQRAGSGGRVF
jgi:integrase